MVIYWYHTVFQTLISTLRNKTYAFNYSLNWLIVRCDTLKLLCMSDRWNERRETKQHTFYFEKLKFFGKLRSDFFCCVIKREKLFDFFIGRVKYVTRFVWKLLFIETKRKENSWNIGCRWFEKKSFNFDGIQDRLWREKKRSLRTEYRYTHNIESISNRF